MPANKTVEISADVAAFIASITDVGQRADAKRLIDVTAATSGHPPKIWGPSIIGFGNRHYKYDSGREGDTLRIGFSPRKGKIVIYGMGSQLEHLGGLGNHVTGKGCLYIKKLPDVDMGILGEAISAALAHNPEH